MAPRSAREDDDLQHDDTRERDEHHDEHHDEHQRTGTTLRLEVRPERRLIRPTGSKRHVVFSLAVDGPDTPSETAPREHRALRLALVLDRSGSMQGTPLDTAKQTLISIVETLDERDEVAVVIFDDQIDVLQPAARVTPEVKRQVRHALLAVAARGSTALHEGWLAGCRAIAPEAARTDDPRLTRCLLLTDGQANVGLTENEVIATEAREIRERTGVSTSTFGFGADYNELLLAPMAVAGGGQFHHIRSASEIANALRGETGDLRLAAALRVCLEVEAQAGMDADVISMYRLVTTHEAAAWQLDLGDLLNGDERHVVMRFSFPSEDKAFSYEVRARVVWTDDAGTHRTEWASTSFIYGPQEACSAEPRDPAAMHWIGLHHADRVHAHVVELAMRGEGREARALARRVRRRIAEYAGTDTALLEAMRELRELEESLAVRMPSTMEAKEAYYSSQRHSRGQKDYRSPEQ